MIDEVITVWITQHVFSRGICKFNVKVTANSYLKRIILVDEAGREGFTYFVHDYDFHLTPESAVAQVEKMRGEKLDDLRKQIAKLEAMKFEVPK